MKQSRWGMACIRQQTLFVGQWGFQHPTKGFFTPNMELIGNWLVVDLPLWKMMEFVSWDDDIPNISGKS